MESVKKHRRTIGTSTEVSNQEKAFLVHGTRKIPIDAESASKYSLSFKYLEDQPFIASDEPINLLIQNNGQSVELGPCRILPSPDMNEVSGRLVFLNDVYDIHRLLRDQKVVNLQSAFQDLPHIIAHKEKIHPSFKEYTADLAYDLSVYKKIFDDLDSQYCEEPEEVRSALQKAIIGTKGPEFRRFFEDKLKELKSLVDDFSLQEHQRHGFYFRIQLSNFILDCPFAARAALKPRGYAGDSEQMRMIYLNDYQGNSTLSKLMHKHAVEHTASESVRNRINIIAKMIRHYKNKAELKSMDKTKVLSVGCGAAFELQKILKSHEDCGKYHFTLFDQDSVALSEAAELINDIERELRAKSKVDFIQGSVRTMLFSRQLRQKLGQLDFIYSLGLFDYLEMQVAKAVFNRLYGLLKPGGELVVGNFHVSNPSRYYMEYWGDWALLHRTEEEIKSLFRNNSSGKASIFYDETKAQMLLHIKKLESTL